MFLKKPLKKLTGSELRRESPNTIVERSGAI